MKGIPFTPTQIETLAKYGYSVDENTKHLQAPGAPQPSVPAVGSYVSVRPADLAVDKNIQNRWQTRFSAELAHSISQYGVRVPVDVMAAGDRLIVINGHHRVTHSLLVAPDKPLPVHISPVRTLREATIAQYNDNAVRLEISPMDRISGMNHLRTVGKMTLEEVGKATPDASGKPLKAQEVNRLLKILAWPTPVQRAYDEGLRESVGAQLATLDQANAERALIIAADIARERAKAAKSQDAFSYRDIRGDDITKALAELGAPVPPRIKFSAVPATIVAGNGTMLTWDVSFADKLEISSDEGKTFAALNPVEDAKKELTVSPSVDTIYVLKATNGAGEQSARVKITVREAPKTVAVDVTKLPDGSDARPSHFIGDDQAELRAAMETAEGLTDEISALTKNLDVAAKGANDAASVAAISAEIEAKKKMLADAETSVKNIQGAAPIPPAPSKPSDAAKVGQTPILGVGEIVKMFGDMAKGFATGSPLHSVLMGVPRLITGQISADGYRSQLLTFSAVTTDAAREEIKAEVSKEFAKRIAESQTAFMRIREERDKLAGALERERSTVSTLQTQIAQLETALSRAEKSLNKGRKVGA